MTGEKEGSVGGCVGGGIERTLYRERESALVKIELI